MDKTGRNGIRVGDIASSDFMERYNALKHKHLELLKIYPDIDFDLDKEEAAWFDSLSALTALQLVDCEYYINDALNAGKRILAEGAQGSMLDIDFGTYPFVTSSNTITAGVCTGLGVAPQRIGRVIGITKAYCTRVGSGPFPSELLDNVGDKLREIGNEFGSTTGRPRRCGWIDIPQLKYTIMLNGVTELCMTKIDVLNAFESIGIANSYNYGGVESEIVPFDLNMNDMQSVMEMLPGWNCPLDNATQYDDLPEAALHFIKTLENHLGVRFTMISTGPEREKLIVR
jgi:adenylosuccinate synthase